MNHFYPFSTLDSHYQQNLTFAAVWKRDKKQAGTGGRDKGTGGAVEGIEIGAREEFARQLRLGH